MENVRKGTKVKKILDGTTEIIKLKGYVMLEDTWVHEENKILYNKKGDKFLVLGFHILEKEQLPNIHIRHLKPIIEKFSCVLLNKPIKIDDVLYTYL
mgnify:CR=1 FL=1